MSVFKLPYELGINKNWLSFKYNPCLTKPNRHSASYLDFIKFALYVVKNQGRPVLCTVIYLIMSYIFKSIVKWGLSPCKYWVFAGAALNGENGCWRKQTPYALCSSCMSPLLEAGWSVSAVLNNLHFAVTADFVASSSPLSYVSYNFFLIR